MPLLCGNARTGVRGKCLPLVSQTRHPFLSRMGFARLAENTIRKAQGKGEHEKLTAVEKIFSSSVGGALGTWNQPIEVVRVEVGSFVRRRYCHSGVNCYYRCSPWPSRRRPTAHKR